MSSTVTPSTDSATATLWPRLPTARLSNASPGSAVVIPPSAARTGSDPAVDPVSRDSVEVGAVPARPLADQSRQSEQADAPQPPRSAPPRAANPARQDRNGAPAKDSTTEEGAPSAGSETGQETDSTNRSTAGEKLAPQEQREVQKLSARDREVKAHEQAHLSAAGPYARGGSQYEYQTGPDGQQYAVGGEVGIDTSRVPDDPEATIRKAQVVRRAALAPAEPSPQDRQVAAEATRMESQARQEVTRKGAEGRSGQTDRAETTRTEEPEEPSLAEGQPDATASSIPEATSPIVGATQISSGVATLTRPRVGQVLDLVA